jgi:hypothetical protein
MNTCTIVDIAKNPYTYHAYKDLIAELVAKESNSGEVTPERIIATKINAQRIKRIDRQFEAGNEIKNILKQQKKEWLWIVLVESWCGDAAQNIPVIAKIAEQSPKIELKLILRDENPEIMDAYLTNNSRSIPKLICIDKESGEEVGTWGPRPKEIQALMEKFKKLNPDVSHSDFIAFLHTLYTREKGNSLQKEFANLLKAWNK